MYLVMLYMGYDPPMRTKCFCVTLTPAERDELRRLISSGTAPARKMMHARILLKADATAGEHGAFDEDIETLGHLSPALYDHINPYGTYQGDLDAAARRQGLRPLRRLEASPRLSDVFCSVAIATPKSVGPRSQDLSTGDRDYTRLIIWRRCFAASVRMAVLTAFAPLIRRPVESLTR